jgi:exonuclease SbcC
MPDADAIWRGVADAEARLAVARTRAAEADVARSSTAERLSAVAPQWLDAQAQRDQTQQLLAELRVAESEAMGFAREVERLDRELDAVAVAHRELAPLREALLPLLSMRAELESLEQLAAADARRQALMERVRTVAEDDAKLAERAARLEAAPTLERDTQQQIATLRGTLTEVERTFDAESKAWTRDGQEAETRLDALRRQYAELSEQRDTLEGLGEESPCPTCGRPLGASYRGVLDLLNEQIETVRIDGNYYRQRVEQLAVRPAAIDAMDEQRRTLQMELSAAERRLLRIQNALVEATQVADSRAELATRLAQATEQLAALPLGYDPQRHRVLRDEVVRLQELETKAARVGGLVEREDVTRTERLRVTAVRDAARSSVVELERQRSALGMDDTSYQRVRDAHERAAADARRAELDAVSAGGEAERARAALDSAEQGRRDLGRLQDTLDALETDKQLHDELDRALTDLRTDLNFQLRPELAEIASGFLDGLTDGRYSALEFDEDYKVLVMEEGLPKPVISGGEEDLCNLVLRLAISQMIAERAGQAFSLLILDEVFGSLDETRRANVVELLRHLHDRFEQVIVITHIEQVREGLDRVLLVRFDETRGCSVVHTSAPVLPDEPLDAELLDAERPGADRHGPLTPAGA